MFLCLLSTHKTAASEPKYYWFMWDTVEMRRCLASPELVAKTDVAGWEALYERGLASIPIVTLIAMVLDVDNTGIIRSAGIKRSVSDLCVYSSTIIIIISFSAIFLFTFMFLLFMRFVLNEIMILKLWINRLIDDDDDDDKIDLSF